MALPDDMQVVPVILLKSDVQKIERLRKALRQSRSEFLRNLVAPAIAALSLSDCSLDETKASSEDRAAA